MVLVTVFSFSAKIAVGKRGTSKFIEFRSSPDQPMLGISGSCRKA